MSLRLALGLGSWCAFAACGGPIPTAETPSQTLEVDGMRDAAAAADTVPSSSATFHLMTVTSCAKTPTSCEPLGPGAASDGRFRVAFGHGAGTLRSRDQAITDLYRELRDRTSLESRLTASSRPPEHVVAASEHQDSVVHARSSAAATDPIADAAFSLLEAAETDGELTLDVARDRSTCKVGLGAIGGDAGRAGHSRCLVEGPERPGRIDAPSTQERERDRDHTVGQ